MKKAIALALVLGVSGCSHTAKPQAIGAFNVYSSYSDKLPGKYLLYVDASALDTVAKPSDINCAAHKYPLNMQSGFQGSVRKTFSNLVEELEVVTSPVNRSDLQRLGARGMIVVRGEDVDTRLRLVPGMWTASVETDVEIAASIVVDGRKGRLLGKTVSGDKRSQADAGMMCEGGAKALAQSAEGAMKEAVRRLAEELSNSERVRS